MQNLLKLWVEKDDHFSFKKRKITKISLCSEILDAESLMPQILAWDALNKSKELSKQKKLG